MTGSIDPTSPSWKTHNSLNQGQAAAEQSFPLQGQSSHINRCRSYDDDNDDNDSENGSEIDNRDEFRVAFAGRGHRDGDADDEDEDEDEEDLEAMDDIAPLAGSKWLHGYSKPSSRSESRSLSSMTMTTMMSRASQPCKILATTFGAAMIVALAFAVLSLLHLNTNTSLDQAQDDSSNNSNNGTDVVDNRFLKPPAGISVDDFKLSDFKLPPWEWNIDSFSPINVTNGVKFAHIQWKNGEQYLSVDCPRQLNYLYHFPSFPKNEFRDYLTASQGIDDLLHLGEEPFVFVLCPPGINNANLVFREFDAPEQVDENGSVPEAPPHIEGTMEAPRPLLDDVVMILVDAVSRAKFLHEMKAVMATIAKINSTAGGETGHRIFDFEHFNVLGQNSPPNKAYIYSGQSIENIKHGPKHWVWDVYEEQGFRTAHTDGECGGEQGVHDYTSGAITFEYSHLFGRIPAQYQMPQTGWCENHNMHVSGVWGRSCSLPEGVDYKATLMGGMRWNTPYCAGEMAIHEHIMENLEGWLASTKGKRRFATYSFMDTHSPDHHHVSFDVRFATFIENLLVGRDGRPPLLSPKSAFVIMADHGLHYGRETYTFEGFIHHKIPPLFVALPNQFINSRPDFLQALEQNQNRIISHLDLHQTFLHLAYGDMPVEKSGTSLSYTEYMADFIANGTFRQRFHPDAPSETSYAQIYGRSLLLPIDEDRSCHSGGIPNDFCAFQPFLDLDPSKQVDATFLRGADGAPEPAGCVGDWDVRGYRNGGSSDGDSIRDGNDEPDAESSTAGTGETGDEDLLFHDTGSTSGKQKVLGDDDGG
ncbi:hypothetical protein BGZ58_006978 [Dissophora ornata]|nr:hypothetical protein BGZ58_006978 [Dissophora ornata]